MRRRQIPPYAATQWYEIWVAGPGMLYQSGTRLDRRRRRKATAERIADELRSSKNYFDVWLVEVNRLR